MTQHLLNRFDELTEQMEVLFLSRETKYVDYLQRSIEEIDCNKLLEWRIKTRNLLSKACGVDSEHYREFLENEKTSMYGRYLSTLERLRAIFIAAKEDFVGGYLESTKSLIQAEVFDSELEQARELLNNGYCSAAAVIAGVVLETTLRELCDRNGISYGKLDKMNADLAKLGIFNKLVQKRITTLADIRNSAAHGNAGEFSKSDVDDMIRDVERFVAEHLPK
ncbi:MAG: hypothetical protein U0929_04900 [Planctomycetaceae bacterium]